MVIIFKMISYVANIVKINLHVASDIGGTGILITQGGFSNNPASTRTSSCDLIGESGIFNDVWLVSSSRTMTDRVLRKHQILFI